MLFVASLGFRLRDRHLSSLCTRGNMLKRVTCNGKLAVLLWAINLRPVCSTGINRGHQTRQQKWRLEYA